MNVGLGIGPPNLPLEPMQEAAGGAREEDYAGAHHRTGAEHHEGVSVEGEAAHEAG